MLTQKEINQYINCVKKNYNGPYKIKKRFLDELTQAMGVSQSLCKPSNWCKI